MKADSVYILILLQNITAKRFPGFRFLCYCLLLFVTVISVARVCRGLDRFLFFTKALRFKRWKLGSPMTCALMFSSFRRLACFIYNKRV